jgi:hypothetical protein
MAGSTGSGHPSLSTKDSERYRCQHLCACFPPSILWIANFKSLSGVLGSIFAKCIFCVFDDHNLSFKHLLVTLRQEASPAGPSHLKFSGLVKISSILNGQPFGRFSVLIFLYGGMQDKSDVAQ